MDEKELLRLIEDEQRWRQHADREHLRQLSHSGSDLGRWCAQRRTMVRAAALVVLVVVPGIYATLLPQRQTDRVLCNRQGDEQLVLNRACGALGNCSDSQVTAMLQTIGKQVVK